MKQVYFFLFFLYTAITANCQPTFEHYYSANQSYNSTVTGFVLNSDSGFTIAGDAYYLVPSGFIIRTNSSGAMLWGKVFSVPGCISHFGKAIKTLDDNMLVAGYASDQATGMFTSGFAVKVNSVGDTLWTKSFSGANFGKLNSCVELPDSSLLFLGETYNARLLLMHTDKDANVIWRKSYSGTEHWQNIYRKTDGHFLISGQTQSYSDICIAEADSSGNILWAHTLGGSQLESLPEFTITADGKYFLSGNTRSFGAGGYDAFVCETDSLGIIRWTKTYGGPYDDGGKLKLLADGNMLLTGFFHFNSSSAGYAGMLTKIDTSGTVFWSNCYTNPDPNSPGNLTNSFQKTNGQLAAAGIYSYGSFNYGFLMQADSNGRNVCNDSVINLTVNSAAFTEQSLNLVSVGNDALYIAHTDFTYANYNFDSTLCLFSAIHPYAVQASSIRVAPNPFSTTTVFTISNAENSPGDATLLIYDQLGQLVRRQQFENGRTELERGNLSPGMYFYEITNKGVISTGKIIAE